MMKISGIALVGLLASALLVSAVEAKTINLFAKNGGSVGGNGGTGGTGGNGGNGGGGGNGGNGGGGGNSGGGGTTVPTTCSISSVTLSTACQVVAGNNDSVAAMNLFNSNAGVFGITSWLLADKNDDGALISPYDLIANGIGNASGVWNVSSFNNYQYAALVVKGGAVAFVAYLLDLTQLSGTWSTADLINGGGNQPGLSHISLYVGGQQITPPPPPPPPEVPVPAAGLLLLTALGGLGVLRARRAAA